MPRPPRLCRVIAVRGRRTAVSRSDRITMTDSPSRAPSRMANRTASIQPGALPAPTITPRRPFAEDDGTIATGTGAVAASCRPRAPSAYPWKVPDLCEPMATDSYADAELASSSIGAPTSTAADTGTRPAIWRANANSSAASRSASVRSSRRSRSLIVPHSSSTTVSSVTPASRASARAIAQAIAERLATEPSMPTRIVLFIPAALQNSAAPVDMGGSAWDHVRSEPVGGSGPLVPRTPLCADNARW